jgi:hypothetical protein
MPKGEVQDLLKPMWREAVEIVFAFAPRFYQPCYTQQSQVMADGRLTLVQQVTQSPDMQFIFLNQIANDT